MKGCETQNLVIEHVRRDSRKFGISCVVSFRQSNRLCRYDQFSCRTRRFGCCGRGSSSRRGGSSARSGAGCSIRHHSNSCSDSQQVSSETWTVDGRFLHGTLLRDSLISNLKFDGSDIRIRFCSWWFRGYCNAFRRDEKRKNKASVGLGGNISKSLLGIDPHSTPPSRVQNSGRNDSGNGSLMRLAPISIFFADDLNALLDRAGLSSLTTHPGMEAVEACKFLAFLTFVRSIRTVQYEYDIS